MKKNLVGGTMAALTGVASATVGASVDGGGITTIFGNSFGWLGRNETYDYVVIGGGTAGNAIAARLAMDPANYTVAVIQAGSFYEIMNNNRTQIPGYSYLGSEPNLATGSLDLMVALSINTVPQHGYHNRTVPWIVGQMFGGGSAANLGGYHRPNSGAFDWWANITQDDYWKWDNVYNFFKKSCNFTAPDYTKIDPSLNISYDPTAFIDGAGPLHVSYGGFQGPYGPYLDEALARAGFKEIPGLNSGELIGYGTATAAIDPETMTRDSSETSFLQAAVRASGHRIKMYPDTLGSRILFSSNKTAIGVELRSNLLNNPLKYQLNVRREVIVSAGVWFSPQLLMLSGIGPAETLTKHGIDVVADLPGVGRNEWDSPYMNLVYKVNVTTSTQLVAGNPEVVAEQENLWRTKRKGRLSNINTCQGLAFEKYPEHLRSSFSNSTLEWLSTFPADWPETEYLPLEVSTFPADIGPDDYYLTIASALLAPKSVGNMTIRSDVADWPVINPNWLADEGDAEMAVASFKRIREIAGNSSMFISEYEPGPSVSTDAEILHWLRENMSLAYHGSSTCRMGAPDDPMAVTDSRARVRGVTGVRVVDLSAYPNLIPGHPMGSAYAFAEAIADSIITGD